MEATRAASSPVHGPSPEAPPPSPAAPAAVAPSAGPRPSLEEHLGLTWLTRIGAGVFLLGGLFFFKYAVDNAWIGPTGRVGIGCVVGLGLLGIAEGIRAKTRPRFVNALVGIGLSTLVVSLWASAVFYALVPSTVAFVATSAVLLLGAALALRHRAEPTLLVVLVGGLLNPVVLSTGEDRPLELFAYLFLLTSVALAVASRRSFRVVPWLAIVGVVVLFGGWYAKFFDTSDRRVTPDADVPPALLVGAYHEVHARLVPLVAVFAFSALWSVVALALRAERATIRGREPRAPRLFAAIVALAALVVSHAGATALLPDSPRLVALVAIALAVGAIALLRRLASTEFLIVPMSTGFVSLLVVCRDMPRADGLVVALVGAWTVVYVVGFLGGRSGTELSRGAAIQASVAAAFAASLAGAVLFETRPALFALLLAVASGFISTLGARARQTWLGVAAAAMGALALLGGAPETLEHASAASSGAPFDGGFLAATAVWASVHLVAVGDPPLRRGEPIRWTTTLTASIATLGFVGVVVAGTADDVPTLRALLTAAAGCADLLLGTLLFRAAGGVPATLLVGQALGLFAASLAFGFNGATVTVLWAVLAVVAAHIAAHPVLTKSASVPTAAGEIRTQRVWLAVAVLLFIATLVHVGLDVDAVQQSAGRYLASRGREGALAAPAFSNSRAYALAGAGVALLFSARALVRVASFRVPATFLAVLGYALLLALVVTETRAALLHLPPAPGPGLDESEWSVFAGEVEAARSAQQGSLSMMTTLLGAAAATALLGVGFAVRDAFHRYIGLALFVLTLGKLALWDVWHVERIYQIALLTGVGAFTVGGGFLYARFGARLLSLLKTGGAAAPPLVLLVAFFGAAGDARADEPRFAAYAQRRTVTGIDAGGDYALAVDLALFRASLSDALLADVRIVGPDGNEVPYLVEDVAATRPSAVVPSRAVDVSLPGVGPVSSTWTIVDKGATHCRIALALEGDGFLRKVRVETGEEPGAMTTVADGAYVYRILQGGDSVAESVVTYPPSIASLVRVTLLPDGPSTRVGIRGGEVSCAPAIADEPVAWAPFAIEGTSHDAATRTTLVTLDAGDRGIPIRALVLDVPNGEYHRRVEVEATNYRSLWPAAGGGFVYRIEPRPGVILASARIPVTAVRKRYYRVRIWDGDSQPIDVVGVKGEVRARRIVLRTAREGEHTLYVGDELAEPPHYDLADILRRHDAEPPRRTATMGALVANTDFGVAARPSSRAFTERYRTAFGIGLAVLLVGLALWAVRLLRAKDAA
ncbi:MAG TPA: DUF2339 domain-containing protein [Polyangiaceae bacterium]